MIELPAYTAVEGLQLFRCEAHAATLSTKGCAARWSAAQAQGKRTTPAERERLQDCVACPLGAHHAGAKIVQTSSLFGADICPRCGNGTTRMVNGRVCVSCYNREREIREGANARGNRPERLAPIIALPVSLMVDGRRLVQVSRLVAADHVVAVSVERFKAAPARRKGKAKERVERAPQRRGAAGEAILQALRTTKGQAMIGRRPNNLMSGQLEAFW